MSIDTVHDLEEESFKKYFNMRYVEKGKMCPYSVREIECYLKRTEDILSVIEVPEGLAPVDLYFKSEQVASQKLNIIKERKPIEQQYVLLQDFLINRLMYYRNLIIQEMRELEMKKQLKNSKKIFIIHGHNEAKLRELVMLLKEKFDLDPVVLSEQADQGSTIIEKFEKYASECSYAFALFTPDDIVSDGKDQYFQVRPNVIFELGWFCANLGRSKVCILDQESKEGEESRIFSDLQGVMRKPFKENISEKFIEIEQELKSVGIIT